MTITSKLNILDSQILTQSQVDERLDLFHTLSARATRFNDVATSTVAPVSAKYTREFSPAEWVDVFAKMAAQDQSNRAARWADYSLEPVFHTSEFKPHEGEDLSWDKEPAECGIEADCEIESVFEIRFQQLEDRLAKAEMKIQAAEHEAREAKEKLKQSEQFAHSLMARVMQLENKQYDIAATERAQRAVNESMYNEMLRRVTSVEQKTSPYWGQSQITCSGATSITTLPLGSDIDWYSLTTCNAPTSMSTEQAKTICSGIGAGVSEAGISQISSSGWTLTKGN